MTDADRLREVGALLRLAQGAVAPDARAIVDDLTARLHAPLRVAVAGRVKAGKSTLVNALLGDRLATTGLDEATHLVTWYRWHHAPAVVVARADDGRPTADPPRSLPFSRVDGALRIRGAEGLGDDEGLAVGWPTPALRELDLVDTPGSGAVDGAAGARTARFFDRSTTGVPPVDAVLYVLRRRHPQDVAFLEAFRGRAAQEATPQNAIAVLSRADEVGGGGIDAMEVAAAVAADLAADPRLRGLCQGVVPVCGLLAEAATTMTEAEGRELLAIGAVPGAARARLVRSVDDFRGDDPALPVGAERRAALLARFGLFGIRRAVLAHDAGVATTTALADTLLTDSGLPELRSRVAEHLGGRAAILRGRTIVDALDAVLEADPEPRLAAAVEADRAADHGSRELAHLQAIRRGHVDLAPELAARAEAALGAAGPGLAARLGLAAPGSPAELLVRAQAEIDAWRALAAAPFTAAEVVPVAEAAARSIEGAVGDAAG